MVKVKSRPQTEFSGSENYSGKESGRFPFKSGRDHQIHSSIFRSLSPIVVKQQN